MMNDSLKEGLISLIKSAISGENQELPEGFDIADIVEIARKHQIIPLVYYGALNCGINTDTPAMTKMFEMVCNSMIISQRQMFSINRIADKFTENGIDYMLLKGTLLKSLYSKVEMRSMGDADILIKMDQYDKIKPILIDLGYKEKIESDHELIWTKPELYLELHKHLIPSYNKDYYTYYGDGWQLGRPSEENKYSYVMTAEDQMIYLFTHFAKHYRDGGIGIKHLTDLYVYRKSNPDLNEEYLKLELQKLKLYEFYINVLKTIDVWFSASQHTVETKLITDFIIGSGAYGTIDKKNVAMAVRHYDKDKGYSVSKFKRFFGILFPKIEVMKNRYNYLVKTPILLPVAWVVRIFDTIFNKRERVKVVCNRIQKVSLEEVSDYEKTLRYVGLDFNFRE